MSFAWYPRYKDSGVEWLGEVPEHWSVRRLKHISPLITVGIVVNPSTFVAEEGFPFIYGGDIGEGVIDWKNARCIDAASSDANAKTRLKAGDLLTVRVGAQGVTAVVPVECEGGNCASLMLIRQGSFNSHWLCYAMNTRAVRFQVEVVQYGAAQEQFNISHAVNFWTPTPPRTEQDEIVQFLELETAKIDALVEEQRRLIELLREKRQAVISHAVTKGLNPHAPMKPSGVEWLGDVPKHWSVKRLKHVSPSITVGIVINPSTFVPEVGFPFIYGGDIREGVIDWKNARCIDAESSDSNAKTRLKAGDLLTVRVGAPGVTAVVPVECEGGNCASVMLIRQGGFNSQWLCYAMNARIVRFQVEVVQYGAAQEQFNISHAVNFWVPTPPRAEQDEIAYVLERETARFDALTAEAQRAIDLLEERRAALISAAVTGKIDVRGLAESEAA